MKGDIRRFDSFGGEINYYIVFIGIYIFNETI
jgi:hypothetical protein